ncbi:D-alanyl-D-alanine carboxypeptidase [Aphanothece sacrum]|uniref:Peptidase n=1 Tax=Aphanothece sacrum FPU1 TaxID=1920663 RepID=A0A401II17_APHSA|nr:D-alanyl-D-alanine carboxypeptidase [Aphanothece sacrum]GBF80894.1 peptidase [Aphanothece sacrum FPU1]GBF85201.1 peptidase [Aphanothece sacrum FPU3]
MQELLGFAVGHLLMNLWGRSPAPLQPVPLVAWQEAKIFQVPTEPDPVVEKIVADYLKQLASLGVSSAQQGVWIQSEWAYLGEHGANIPASAASLTKVATSLAALATWGTNHRFETLIYTVGPVKNGILQGDLIIQGGGDPLFVWEEAIALGNQLNQLGIRQVKGNLIILGRFSVNFQSNPQLSGELLQVGLNQRRWTPSIEQTYRTFPPKTPRPQVAIARQVKVENTLPTNAKLLMRHQSLTLAELLKKMNLYSNNAMAQMLADELGGASVVAKLAAQVAKLPPGEISLINGSGLGVENRISPRATVQMLMTIEQRLGDNPLEVKDLFPMAGRDKKGTAQLRNIPDGVAFKTGTLAQVSALAGVIPTQERGPVWFAIINYGNNVDRFRVEQDRLLQRLAQHWQLIPLESTVKTNPTVNLGDPKRNIPQQS